MIDQYHWIMAAGSVLLAVCAVVMHYEILSRLNAFITTTRWAERPRILALIFVLLIAHIGEIWLFGIGALLMLEIPALGSIAGLPDPTLFETVYLSATTYTTLGYGDITPVGNIRFLYGTEALTGLVLITWSASLTFVELQRHWRRRADPDR
tara:strand:- start:2207 stop:2662 length:456 start_codon:yes stop_codon:yes gene_type:complete